MTKSRSIFFLQLLFVLNLVGLPLGTFAASFDCGKATTSTEKLICRDTETSALDSKLQRAYQTALAATSEAVDQRALTKEQRNWISYTRGTCQETACLRQAYAERIAVLARNAKNIENEESYCIKPSGCRGGAHDCGVSVQVYRDPNGRVGLFNQSLSAKKLSGRIIGCRRLIDLWDGTHLGPGRGEFWRPLHFARGSAAQERGHLQRRHGWRIPDAAGQSAGHVLA